MLWQLTGYLILSNGMNIFGCISPCLRNTFTLYIKATPAHPFCVMEQRIGIPAVTRKELEHLQGMMYCCSQTWDHFPSTAQANHCSAQKGPVTRVCCGSLTDLIALTDPMCIPLVALASVCQYNHTVTHSSAACSELACVLPHCPPLELWEKQVFVQWDTNITSIKIWKLYLRIISDCSCSCFGYFPLLSFFCFIHQLSSEGIYQKHLSILCSHS